MINFFFNNKFNIKELLFLIIPISIVAGNFILNLNIALIILFFFYDFFKKKISFSSKLKIFLLIFFFLILFNIFFSENKELTIRGWVGIIKNMIFFFYFVYLLQNEASKQRVLKFYLCFLIFVIFDTILQYILGYDIFGFPAHSGHGYRLSGPFGDEFVVGAFISKMFFISALVLINNSRVFLIYSFLLISLITIFLTQERSAFFISMISTLVFILFNEGKALKKLFFILISFVILFLFAKQDSSIYKKYINLTLQQTGVSKTLNYQRENDKKSAFVINSFWDSRYGAHFLTAYEIFLDHPIVGSGAKTFRSKCSDEKYDKIRSAYKKKRCNTHPHNIYFELFSETGFIGAFVFIYIIGFLLVHSVIKFFKEKKDLHLINICILIVLFFPIQTTGSFFSTFNGVFYWLGLGVVYNNLKLNFFRISFQKK